MKLRAPGLTLAIACIALPTHALCPHPTPKVCSAFFESDAVYVAKVLKKEVVDAGKYAGSLVFTLEVAEVFRGRAGPVERVSTENDSGRWIAEVGQTHVVFASRGQVGGRCAPLDEPERVPETIRQIRALAGMRTATIEGHVLSSSRDGAAIAGAALKVTAPGTSHSVVTDSHGDFRLEVAPGHYRLQADGLHSSDYSGRGLADIRLNAGQCAQFELVKR